MGRNKIKIERITNERTRLVRLPFITIINPICARRYIGVNGSSCTLFLVQATFNKRKNGLVKKAMELAILCGCEVALIVIGNNKLTQYSSSDMDQLLLRYTDGGFEEPHADPLTSDDYPKLFGKKNKTLVTGTCASSKESPAKKPRVESPTPLQAQSAPSVKPLASAAHHDGRSSPSAAPVPTLVPRGPSPPLGVKPVSPTAGFARLAAPQQQLAASYPAPYMVGGGYPATRTGQFPSSHQQSSSSSSRSNITTPSLYSAPSTSANNVNANSSTPGGRIVRTPPHPKPSLYSSRTVSLTCPPSPDHYSQSPPSHRGSFAAPGSVSPTFESAKPQSPHSNPPTPPGSSGQYAEEMRRASSAGRLHQEQQFAQKLNKKNLSLAIPDASSVSSSASFPGSSSSGHSRHTTYTPGFTGLNVPSGMPFGADHDHMSQQQQQHSAVLPSPSTFFAGETPEPASYAMPAWGSWMTSSSPRHHHHHDLPQERFLSRDLNMALHDGTLHQQLQLGKQPPYTVGDKRKALDLLKVL